MQYVEKELAGMGEQVDEIIEMDTLNQLASHPMAGPLAAAGGAALGGVIGKGIEKTVNWYKDKKEKQAQARRLGQQSVAEGFGSYYSEQLAEKVFAQMPNLQNQDDIVNAGYAMAKKEPNLGTSVNGIFRDRDFVSDFVTNYGYLQKQGMAEDLDTDGVMMTRPSNMSSESADPVLRLKQMLKY
jgi:hypothetical protein